MALIPKSGRARSKGSVTLDDVGRLAGVSAMTVSRVVNGDATVSQARQAIVRRALRQLDYIPNIAARTLASGAATHIGLLHSNPSSAYLSQIIIGALNAARERGCRILVEECGAAQPEEQADVVRRLAESGIKGVILVPPLSESVTMLAGLQSIGIPAVTIGPNPGGSNPPNVRIDDFRAAEEMAMNLLRLGHRKIGFIKGPPDQKASCDRLNGFLAALGSIDIWGFPGAVMRDS